MNRGVRHKVQRERRKRLKADCVVLLDRFQAWLDGARIGDNQLLAEIAEMRLRMNPPPGVKVEVVRTAYKGVIRNVDISAPPMPETPMLDGGS